MAESTSQGKRIRAGGRSEVIRRTVAETVLDMLRQGDSTFSVADVAKRADLPRSTVYRWWPTRVDLVGEALTLHTTTLTAPDTGSWEGDVRELTEELADLFSTPVEMALNAILAADTQSEIAQLQVTHWLPIASDLSSIVQRGKDRGEVRADADPHLVMQMIVGPLLVVTTFGWRGDVAATARDVAATITRAFGCGG
ncbi:TetR/AcrR family transcriptional regulator C-terminal ligand-binding domain-containing protein [Tomitella fengzijianii]|nr:TetR/AcrR family transcriptional regulator C-terminal ligand-binding domain-containing protein [Tomitella fengzijianii]